MQNGRTWTGLIKFRIRTSGKLLWTQQLTFGFHTMPGIPSWGTNTFSETIVFQGVSYLVHAQFKSKIAEVILLFYVFCTVLPNTLFHLQDYLYCWHVKKLYHTTYLRYNHLPEDKPSGSKHVEDLIKIKILVSQRCILLVYIMRDFITYLFSGRKSHECQKYKFVWCSERRLNTQPHIAFETQILFCILCSVQNNFTLPGSSYINQCSLYCNVSSVIWLTESVRLPYGLCWKQSILLPFLFSSWSKLICGISCIHEFIRSWQTQYKKLHLVHFKIHIKCIMPHF